MGILSDIIIGSEHVEPAILANAAVGRSLLLVGSPGTAKTTIVQLLAQAYSEDPNLQRDVVVFDLRLPDLVPVPRDPDTLADGENRSAESQSQEEIWNKRFLAFEEIGQASPEHQHLILEVLRQKRWYGVPLSYRLLLATIDSDAYAAMLRLNPRLPAAFSCVVPLRDFNEIQTPQEIRNILTVNLFSQFEEVGPALRKLFATIEASYHQLLAMEEIQEAVLTYTSDLLYDLLSSHSTYHPRHRVYISPRRFIVLAEQILILAAYYWSLADPETALEAATQTAIHYALAAPYGLELGPLMILHRKLRNTLQKRQEIQLQESEETDELTDELPSDEEPLPDGDGEDDLFPLDVSEELDATSTLIPSKKKSSLFGLRKG